MNIKDLEYYQKLVETRSYTKTAEFFNLSQPSISAAIKRLSKEFNTQLITQKRHVAALSLLLQVKFFMIEVAKYWIYLK